jgi:hypothetical protein
MSLARLLPQSFYKEGPTGRANAPRLALDIDATRMLIGAQ